jgi:hypothetical protein
MTNLPVLLIPVVLMLVLWVMFKVLPWAGPPGILLAGYLWIAFNVGGPLLIQTAADTIVGTRKYGCTELTSDADQIECLTNPKHRPESERRQANQLALAWASVGKALIMIPGIFVFLIGLPGLVRKNWKVLGLGVAMFVLGSFYDGIMAQWL